VKELLSREGVPFTAYNVDEDGRAYDELIARGYRTVPVTVIGAVTVQGFDEAALMTAIADLKPGSP
jgi:glutaredoxin